MEFKSGTYTSITTWESQTWNERKLSWSGNNLVTQWNFTSDWKPVPFNPVGPSWEPVFHATLSGSFVYVPGGNGSVYKLNKSDGAVVAHYSPLGDDSNIFLTGPITADSAGTVYYNALKLNMSNPWAKM